jgi:hypothetical protein
MKEVGLAMGRAMAGLQGAARLAEHAIRGLEEKRAGVEETVADG